MSAKEELCEANVELVHVRKRQDRSIETRKRIISAATKEFSISGFDGVTTRSIAKRAKVPHGSVIYHFETKFGVWKTVMEGVINEFHETFKKTLEEFKSADDVTKLKAFQRKFIELSASHPQYNWLMSQESGEGSKRLSWLIDSIVGRDIEESIELISKVQKLGKYVNGDPTHLHYLFVGAASRIFMLSGEVERTMGKSPFSKEFVKSHVALCEQLFFR